MGYTLWISLVVIIKAVDNNGAMHFSEFVKQEKIDLADLDFEASSVGKPFKPVWEMSGDPHQLFSTNDKPTPDFEHLYRNDEVLNMAEIRMLISYCIDDYKFFSDLNKDSRDSFIPGGGKYPMARKILTRGLQKLRKHQDYDLPNILYRAEPAHLYQGYVELFTSGDQGILKQFTSTSETLATAQGLCKINAERCMVTILNNPKAGADITDFSVFDEYEILLLINTTYYVEKATMLNGKERVELTKFQAQTETTSGQEFINLHIMLVTVCVFVRQYV